MRIRRRSAVVRTIIHETEGPIKLFIERESHFVDAQLVNQCFSIWYRRKENSCNAIVQGITREDLALDMCASTLKRMREMGVAK